MTEALYHTDAYLKEFDAAVTAVDGNKVALDRTAFYPGGGGQPNDVGTLTVGNQTWNVIKVSKQGADIWHELDREPAADRDAGSRRTRLGAPLPVDAHAHRHAHPVRRHLPRLRRERDRRQHGAAEGPHGF